MSTEPGFKEEQEVTLLASEANSSSPADPYDGDSPQAVSIEKSSPPAAADDNLKQTELSDNQTVFDDRDQPRLTLEQILSNIGKSLFAADSVLSMAVVLLCVLVISICTTYFQATARARTDSALDSAPLALPIGLITAVTGEPDMSYSFLVTSTNAQGMLGREKSIELAAKFITDHHLQQKRSPVADSLGCALQTEFANFATKDRILALLKDVIPNQAPLHEGLAWQHVRHGDFGAAIDEQKKCLELLPRDSQYQRSKYESMLITLLLTHGRWSEVIKFSSPESDVGREREFEKVDALFHSNQLSAASQLLSKIEPEDYKRFYEEGLWIGRILLQENKLAEAREYANSLLASDGPEKKEAGMLLMTEILIAESTLASNTKIRQQLLEEAIALLDKTDGRGEETAEQAMRVMQLRVLSGNYSKAMTIPGLEKFEGEDSSGLRQRALFYANRALCNFHLKSPALAMRDVDSALKIDPSLAKALRVGILVCSKTGDTAKLHELKEKLSQVKNRPRLQTEI